MSEPGTFRIDVPRRGIDPHDADAIWEILVQADGQFIPPLSSRTSTVQSDLSTSALDPDGPREYFDALRAQHLLVSRDESGRAVGFMSFRKDYRLPEAASVQRDAYFYVSTVIVEPAFRRRGITRAMYDVVLEESCRAGQGVATRTWSTNAGHLALLEQLGIDVVHRVPEGRGPGVDTLYLARTV